MSPRGLPVLFAIVIALCVPGAAFAKFDAVSIAVRGKGEPVLRWVRLADASGFERMDHAQLLDDALHFQPGGRVVYRLPAGKMLRGAVESGNLNDVRLFVSGDGGLWLESMPVPGADGSSFVFAPNFGRDMLCSMNAEKAVVVRAAVSESPVPPAVIRYRDHADVAGRETDVEDPLSDAGKWVRAGPDEPATIHAGGLSRLRIDSRLVFEHPRSDLFREYRILAEPDDAPVSVLEFQARPETVRPVMVDGEWPLLGRLETGFLNLPQGGRAVLRPSAPVLLRIRACDPPDYLLPALNAPSPSVVELTARPVPAEERESFWSLTEHQAASMVRAPAKNPVATGKASLLLAHDNSRRASALVGAEALERAGKRYPKSPEIERRAREFRGLYTGRRTVYPDFGPDPVSMETLVFQARTLMPLDTPGLTVSSARMRELLAGLSRSEFSHIADRPARYALPEFEAPTSAQVIIADPAFPAEFRLRVGTRPPVTLRLEPSGFLPPEMFQPASSSAGLLLAGEAVPEASFSTLAGPYATLFNPAPMTAAAIAEFEIGPEVREIILEKVRGPDDIKAAVQYRAFNTFSMDDPAFTDTVKLSGESGCAELFAGALAGTPPARCGDACTMADLARFDLYHHWLPAARHVRALYEQFRAGIVPGPEYRGGKAEDAHTLRRRAEAAEARKEWNAALRLWAELFRTGVEPASAALGIARVLGHLGEFFMAETMLKGVILYPGEDGNAARDIAVHALAEMYEKQKDVRALAALHAACAVLEPGAARFAAAGRALLEAGYIRNGLDIGYAFHGPEDLPQLVEAALNQGRFAAAGALASKIQAGGARATAEGLILAARNQPEQARGVLLHGDERGREAARSIEWGKRISRLLASPDPAKRVRGVREWGEWAATLPVEHVYADAPETVVRSAGIARLYSVPRDIRFSMFKGNAEQPVSARIQGPARVMISVRPLHASASADPVEGWVEVRAGERMYQAPVNSNRPAQGLDIETGRGVPGSAVRLELAFGPGVHEFDITADTGDFLADAAVRRPVPPVWTPGVVSEHGVRAALSGAFVTNASAPAFSDFNGPAPEQALFLPAEVNGTVRSLPLDVLREAAARAVRVSASADLGGERFSSARRGAFAEDGFTDEVAEAAGRGDFEEARDILAARRMHDPENVTDQDIRDEMAFLVRSAESGGEQRVPAMVRAEVLADEYPQVDGLAGLLRRAAEGTHWEHEPNIVASAGIRAVESVNLPESPMIQARLALVDSPSSAEHLLYGSDPLAFFVSAPRTVRLEFDVSAESLPYFNTSPVSLVWELDDAPGRSAELPVWGGTERISVRVPPGDHAIRFRILDRTANQFVRIRPVRPPHGCALSACRHDDLHGKVERFYHVATRGEPVVALVDGPARVRIDRLESGEVVSVYRTVEPGRHELRLLPPPGRSEASLRIHRKVLGQGVEKPPVETPPRTVEYRGVPDLVVRLDAEPRPVKAEFTDVFPEYTPWSGTWELNARAARRRDVDEDSSGASKPEQYLQFGAAFRRYEEDISTYWKTEAFVRTPEHGGPVWSLGGNAAWRPEDMPLTVRLRGIFYAQNPGYGGMFEGDRTEWSGLLRAGASYRHDLGRKTFHLPSVSIFGRALSMESNTRYSPQAVDQDVFTNYKADHKAGWTIADTLYHRPWLDTYWFLGGAVTSNEDFNIVSPDHARLRTGWRQQAGPVQVWGEYRLTHYFKDADRSRESDRNLLRAGVFWDHWFEDLDRFRVGVSGDYDLDRGETSGFISFSWFFSQGRGLLDFDPGEDSFNDLRRRNIPETLNNAVRYDDTE